MGANSSDDHEQQLLVGNSDNTNIDQQQQQQQHVVINNIIRFKCSFCGRGFSNAQALGGHMNVHRRDRAAKFNINNASSSSSDTIQYDQSQVLPWNIISPRQDQECQDQQEEEEEEDNEIHVKQHYHKPQQLPLFVDTAIPSRLVTCKDDDHDHVIIAKTHQSSSSHGHDLAQGDDRELDLELRLGPDRPGDSTTGTMSTTSTNMGTSTSTRGFF